MGWKYIMVQSRGRILPVIFPDILVHESVANLIMENLKTEHNDPDVEIYSAGCVTVDIISTWRGSQTLNISNDKKKQVHDDTIMREFDYMHGLGVHYD